MKKLYICLLIILQSINGVHAQNKNIVLDLTLDQAIEIANKQSLYSFRQKNMYISKYWQFRSYKASKLPWLDINTTPIKYTRSFTSRFIDGEDVFSLKKSMNSDAVLKLNQNITATGGEINISSNLQRIQNLDSKNIYYYSTPISIGLSQPINGYNKFKWDSRIEPLKFELAKKQYLQNIQELSIQTTDAFFKFAGDEIDLKIAQTNELNADTLYKIGKGRFEIGTVTQDELLDLELGLLNRKMELTKAKINLEKSRITLNSFLGFDENIKLKCILPEKIPSLKVQVDKALDLALTNNPKMLEYQQSLLEANKDIDLQKGQGGLSANIEGNLGYIKNSNTIDNVYQSPYDSYQDLSVSLGIPIIDWGERKGRIQMATYEKHETEARIKQEKIDFEQVVLINVLEFNLQEEQVKIAAKADTIAQKGFEVTKQRFLIDKVDVIKLNEARKSLDAAKRSYINSLQTYWNSYFNIRKITLYNFEKDQSLIKELDYLLQEN